MLDEWVEKAEADYLAASSLNRRRVHPLPDIVCYHCSQCLEKYLKAVLVHHGDLPPRTHALVALLNLCVVYEPGLLAIEYRLSQIDPYAINVRYPGFTADVAEAREAMRITRQLRRRLRRTLGL